MCGVALGASKLGSLEQKAINEEVWGDVRVWISTAKNHGRWR